MGKHREALKQAIMDEFLGRMQRKKTVGREPLLDPEWLYDEFLPSLSNREEAAVEEILAELIHEGILERVAGRRPTYRLTQKGVEFVCL